MRAQAMRSPASGLLLAGVFVVFLASAASVASAASAGGAAPARAAQDAPALFAGRLPAQRADADGAGRPDAPGLRAVGGPDAIAGAGDWVLGNGTLCAAVSGAGHESVLALHGGVLVDLGHCDRGDDRFIQLQPLFNLSRGNTPSAEAVEASVDGDTARVKVRGRRADALFETVYALDRARPRVLRVTTRAEGSDAGGRLFLFGDVLIHGRASLAAFAVDTGDPSRSTGFAHPEVDPDSTFSMLRGLRGADLQVLVPERGAGIAYGVRLVSAELHRGDGSRAPLPRLSLNGEDFSLLGVLAAPPWGAGLRAGLLSLAQIPFLDVEAGETLVVEREVWVGERADAASVTSRIWADGPLLSARVDDPAASVEIAGAEDGAPRTFARPDPDGTLALRLPPDRYVLRARAPGGRELRRAVALDPGPAALGRLELGAPARLRLPRGEPMRLVFEGLGGTPDPRLGDDGVDLGFGGHGVPGSREAPWISLAGRPGDPEWVALAPGRYRIHATRGPEYDVTSAEIEVEAGGGAELSIEAPPRAFQTPGWIAADFHVHAAPSDDSAVSLRERVASFVAEGAEVLVATDHDRITDYGPLLRELDLAGQVAAMSGAEITTTVRGEANPYTSGHFNAFPLERHPHRYREGVPRHEGRRLRAVIADLRERDGPPLVQLNHPRRGGSLSFFEHLSVAGRPFDPTRPLSAEPNRVLIEPDPERGLRDLDFDAVELMNGPSMEDYGSVRADWLSLLLQGERRAGTANSDSHLAAEIVALPRTYVRLADDAPAALDPAALVRAVREGRLLGTTGPFLAVRLGEAEPGDTFVGEAGELRLAVRAAPWVPVSRARVLVNGAVVDEGPVRAGETWRIPLRFAGDAFVTAEVEGEAGGTYAVVAPGFTPFAFVNPIFVDADGDGRWTPPGLPDPLPPAIRDAPKPS